MKRLALMLAVLGAVAITTSSASAGPWRWRHRVLHHHVWHGPVVVAPVVPVVVPRRVFYPPVPVYAPPYYVPRVRYYYPSHGTVEIYGPRGSVHVGW